MFKREEGIAVTDEAGRLRALRKYRILDTAPEQAFDDLTLIASQICGTPIALISLVDENRQWFKSRVGLEVTETARSVSFCTHAIQQNDTFLVPDALEDPRFRDSPLVQGDPRIRFYAGKPLMTRDGFAVGTICVIDHHPRTLTANQQAALDALQRQAEAQLELRRNIEELRVAIEGIETLGALIPYCSACELNIVIPADPEAIAKVSDGVNELLTRKQWPSEEAFEVVLSVQEALANAIRHGCNNDPSKHVQCCITIDESGEIVIVVRDPGPGFDLSKVPNPLDAANLRKPGGRGVFLINQMMDTVEFTEQGRQVRMRKGLKSKL
ncbi:MAG: ATP-binding protein [Candidatus Solibacter usitatus]|nr:ATP-binding protein [Candidatus Solibacter usitatus]